MAAEEKGAGDEERGAGASHQDDGVAVGRLHCGGCGTGAVEALGAAL
jgi:hypothetical protein